MNWRRILILAILLTITINNGAIAESSKGVTQLGTKATTHWLKEWVGRIKSVEYMTLEALPLCLKEQYVPNSNPSLIHHSFALPGEPVQSGCTRIGSSNLPERQLGFCGHSGNLYFVAYSTYGYFVTQSVDVFVVDGDAISTMTRFRVNTKDMSSFEKVRASLISE